MRETKGAKLIQQSKEEFYGNNQSLGRALARASRSLPHGLREKLFPNKLKILISLKDHRCQKAIYLRRQKTLLVTFAALMISLDKPLERQHHSLDK